MAAQENNNIKISTKETDTNGIDDVLQFITDMYEYFPTVDPTERQYHQDEFSELLNNDSIAWNRTTWIDGNETGTLVMNTSILTYQEHNGNASALYDAILIGATSVILGLMILITVIGNVFVIAAILLERNLQNVANYLIVSLAVADLMVACLVMPLGAVYEISRGWILGPELCDMWTSSDVLCCTASILHLVAIAVDRYWAVTNVDYIHTRNSNRIGIMILVVWTVALIVSLAPQFGWKDPDYLKRINEDRRCLVSQDLAYQVFATCSTFYVPLLVILVLYWKIFQTARKRIRRRQEQRNATVVKSIVTSSSSPMQTGADSEHRNATTVPMRFKRRFLRTKRYRSNNRKKRNAAAEALVASLVMIEGQSTTTTTTIDIPDEPMEEAMHEDDDSNEATTAFTITRAVTAAATATGVAVSNNVSPEKSSTTNNGSASHQSHISDISRVEILAKEDRPIVTECPTTTAAATTAIMIPQQQPQQQHQHQQQQKQLQQPSRREKRETLEAKRERKAAKTLAIITGAFVVCWLPFFIMALLMPLCSTCQINNHIISLFLWLGYFNSTLNPVIYTIFSPEFRQAFKRILCGAHYRRRRRPGSAAGTVSHFRAMAKLAR